MTSPKIAGMTIRVSSGDDIMPPRATYLQRVNAHIAWLAADGRSYIFGTEPCAADLSADHPIWFARQNGGSEVNELMSFRR